MLSLPGLFDDNCAPRTCVTVHTDSTPSSILRPSNFELHDLSDSHSNAIQLYSAQPNAFVEAGIWWMSAYRALSDKYTHVTLITNDSYLLMTREAHRNNIANIETDLGQGLEHFEQRMTQELFDHTSDTQAQSHCSAPRFRCLLIVHWQGIDFPSYQESIWQQNKLQSLIQRNQTQSCSIWISSGLHLSNHFRNTDTCGQIRTPTPWLYHPTSDDFCFRHWICPINVLEFLRRDTDSNWSRYLQTHVLPGTRHLEVAPLGMLRTQQRYISRSRFSQAPRELRQNEWLYYENLEANLPVPDSNDDDMDAEDVVDRRESNFQELWDSWTSSQRRIDHVHVDTFPPPPMLPVPFVAPIPPVSAQTRRLTERLSSPPIPRLGHRTLEDEADRRILAKRRRLLEKQLVHINSVTKVLDRIMSTVQTCTTNTTTNEHSGEFSSTVTETEACTTPDVIISTSSTNDTWGCGICLTAYVCDTITHPLALSCGHMICVQCMIDRTQSYQVQLHDELADLQFEDAAAAIRQQLNRDSTSGQIFICPYCRTLLRSVVKLNPLPLPL